MEGSGLREMGHTSSSSKGGKGKGETRKGILNRDRDEKEDTSMLSIHLVFCYEHFLATEYGTHQDSPRIAICTIDLKSSKINDSSESNIFCKSSDFVVVSSSNSKYFVLSKNDCNI